MVNAGKTNVTTETTKQEAAEEVMCFLKGMSISRNNHNDASTAGPAWLNEEERDAVNTVKPALRCFGTGRTPVFSPLLRNGMNGTSASS